MTEAACPFTRPRLQGKQRAIATVHLLGRMALALRKRKIFIHGNISQRERTPLSVSLYRLILQTHTRALSQNSIDIKIFTFPFILWFWKEFVGFEVCYICLLLQYPLPRVGTISVFPLKCWICFACIYTPFIPVSVVY